MSTFNGIIEEIEGISVDCFLAENYKSSAFFLSHFHTDHMNGLYEFLPAKMSNPEMLIYSSEVTMTLLQHNYPFAQEHFKCLPIGQPCVIEIPGKNTLFSVTLLPAGHCPGSVMFLFESAKTVLYTGDFRLHAPDLHKYKALYNRNGELKKIDKIYLDTTFFYEKWRKFPSREESLEALCEVIKKWTSQWKNLVINLDTSAKYGAEFLFIGIFKRLGKPIHVSSMYYNVNQHFPNMDNAITFRDSQTNIHNFCHGWNKFCTKNSEYHKIKSIKTSAYAWTDWDKNQPVIQECHDSVKICFSCHSSYEETIEFLDFFKPKEISANVEPELFSDKIELYINIDSCLKRYNLKEEQAEERDQTGNSFRNKRRKI